MGFPCGSAGKEYTRNAGDLGSIPGWGRSPGEGKGYPLQYSGMENSMHYIVHGVTKSWTPLSDFHFTSLHFTVGQLPRSMTQLPSEVMGVFGLSCLGVLPGPSGDFAYFCPHPLLGPLCAHLLPQLEASGSTQDSGF